MGSVTNASELVMEIAARLRETRCLANYQGLRNCAGTTCFMRGLLERIAKDSGFWQRREIWRVDVLWFRSKDAQRYWSASNERWIPYSLPYFAIELENYAHENVAAAALRVMGVRAEHRIVIGWDEDPASMHERLLPSFHKAAEEGALPEGNGVAILIFDEKSMGPMFDARRIFNVDGRAHVQSLPATDGNA